MNGQGILNMKVVCCSDLFRLLKTLEQIYLHSQVAILNICSI